jgi:DNA polymerase-3 subunit gamma/tau
MLENVLFQEETVRRLKADLAASRLPPASLFFGPEYTGKGTAAHEVARALSCKLGEADWNCQCRRCEQNRLLLSPDVLLLGWRPFMQEIRASASTLRRVKSLAAQYLFNRAARKLLRRFDPVLWEGEEARLARSAGALEAIGEGLELLGPGSTLPADGKLDSLLESLEKRCSALAEAVPATLPINQVRRASTWSQITPAGRKKTIIIENADLMQEGSRNALLKTIEEPPTSTVLILTTTRRSAIIQTILSRLRTYRFAPRSGEGRNAVIRKIFRDESGSYSSLEAYFRSFHEVSPARFADLAAGFIDGACHQASLMKRIPALFSLRAAAWLNSPNASADPVMLALSEKRAFADTESFSLFLASLADAGEDMLRAKAVDGEARIVLSRWKKLIDEARYNSELLKMAPPLVAQGLFYRMRSVLENK